MAKLLLTKDYKNFCTLFSSILAKMPMQPSLIFPNFK